jgi:ankyrin repeat protein
MIRHLRIALAGAMLALAAAPAAAQFSDSFNFLTAVRGSDGEKVTKALEGDRATIINTRDYSTGETALMITIKRHDMTWSSFLLGRGANPDVKDFKGNTALHYAALLGFQEGAELLLGQAAQINAVNNNGETPLIIAVQQRNVPIVRLLMNNGADPRLPDRIAGKSAHDYATDDPRAAAVLKIIDESKTVVKAKPKVAGPKM